MERNKNQMQDFCNYYMILPFLSFPLSHFPPVICNKSKSPILSEGVIKKFITPSKIIKNNSGIAFGDIFYYIRETDTLILIYYLFSILYSFRKSLKEAKTSLRLFRFSVSDFRSFITFLLLNHYNSTAPRRYLCILSASLTVTPLTVVSTSLFYIPC